MPTHEPLRRQSAFQAVTDYAGDFITLLDLDFRHLFANRSMAQAVGRDPEDFVGKTPRELGTPAPVAAEMDRHFVAVVATGQPEQFEYEIETLAGRRVLQSLVAPVRRDDASVQALIVITRDVTEWRRAEALRNSQNDVMQRIASGAALPELLALTVKLAEEASPGRRCSILLLGPDRTRLVPGHAPNLPPELIDAICAMPIGADNASCGFAALGGRFTVAADIATDPAWARHRTLALAHDLRACWSQPITAKDGALLGTFAMYHRKARAPYPREIATINGAALAAGIAIQHCRAQEDLLETHERFQALTENAANIVSVTDMKGTMRFVSPAVVSMLGRTPEELIGRNAYEWVHPDDLPLARDNFRQLRENVGAQIHATYRYQHKNGSYRLLEVVGKSRLNRLGEYLAVVSARDVTEREEANHALRTSQSRLNRALDASGLGMWDWDLDSGDLYVDRRTVEILGHSADHFRPHIESVLALTHPEDVALRSEAVSRHLRGDTPFYEIDYRVRGAGGQYHWIRSRGQITQRQPDGRALRVTGTIKDIDAERRMQDSLDSALSEIKLLLEATDEGIVGLDATGTVRFANAAATRMLDLPGERLLGHSFDRLVRHTSEDGVDLIGHESPIVRCILEGQRFRGSNEIFWTSETRSLPVEFSVSPVQADGKTHGAVLIFRDVSEKRALAEQLRFQALHDPLTGLINRRGFEARLLQLLGSARTAGRQHALCYVDLDHFKLVNDTCGHAAGDELLRQLPVVLDGVARRHDTIARLGGDEFAVLLEDCPLDRAARVAESILEAVRAFRFVWQHRTFTIGASIGVVGITGDSHGVVSVLGAADAACYVAKDQGPNHVHVSYPHDLAIIRRRGEMRWVAQLKTALEENQFRLHFQSIAAVDRPDDPAMSHELLLRLVNKRGELIQPTVFLPAAERYQLMSSIDQWVVENALRYLGQVVVPDPRLRGHRFGINLSGDSLRDGRLMQVIEDCLKRHGVPAAMLYFEVTETAAIANLGAAVDFIRRLKAFGCQLALDDFGSGMSSFSYLKHLPVDYLKIDGSFVKDLVDNPVDQAIVRSVHAVSRQMGIATIAEYVESPAILECLRGIGIDYAQGFAIARPKPLEEFPLLMGNLQAASA